MSDSQTKTKKAPPSVPRGNNIIAVASGKGGVGKTWFSITLAHALTRMGKKVLLFDGDLGLANVDVQLGLMPKRDLNDVIRGRLSLDKVVQTYEDGDFDIIAGRSGQASLASLPSQRLTLLRDQLLDVAADYDVVICDLGAGIDQTVRMFSSIATQKILIINEEPPSLIDAYAYIKTNSAAGAAKNINIVVNMASSEMEGEKAYRTLTKAAHNFLRLKPPLLGMIRVDPKVKESIRHQTPLLIRSPNTQAAENVEDIASEIWRKLRASMRAAASV